MRKFGFVRDVSASIKCAPTFIQKSPVCFGLIFPGHKGRKRCLIPRTVAESQPLLKKTAFPLVVLDIPQLILKVSMDLSICDGMVTNERFYQ